MSKKRRDRSGFVFSTDPDFEFNYEQDEVETPEPGDQKLRVFVEKKGRKGKPVCVVSGFVGRENDLVELARALKKRCGVGGTAKDGEIVLQGTMKDKVEASLRAMGYGVR